MEIKGRLENEDIVNYNLHHFRNSASIQKRVKMLSIVGPIMFAIGVYIAYKVTDIPLWFWCGVFGVASVVWFQAYPKRMEFALRKNVNKMLAEGDNEGILEDSRIVVDEEGISKINDKRETKVKWDTVNKIAYEDEYIFIYDSSISALIIKDNMFDTDEHKKEFIDTITKYYKQ